MSGTVTVIMGCMYSGKSTRLLEKVRRADLGRRQFLLVKPAVDDRYSDTEVVTHDGRHYASEVVATSADILSAVAAVSNIEVVFIDEGQFFDDELHVIVDMLAARGVDVVVAGLDLDFRAEPFETMVPIILHAEHIERLLAICDNCGADACRSQRLADGQPTASGDQVEVGGVETYEARCRGCFVTARVYARDEGSDLLPA
jgi:thymidine kinase